MTYDPEQQVAAFFAKYGELGEVVLGLFQTIDPLDRLLVDEDDWMFADGFPEAYLAEAKKFIKELRNVGCQRYLHCEVPGDLIATLVWRSFNAITATERRQALTESVWTLVFQLHPELMRLAFRGKFN